MNPIVFAGATSGTGIRVYSRLVKIYGAENILCLVRKTSDLQALKDLNAQLSFADITIPDSYSHLLNSNVFYIDMTHPKHYDRSLAAVIASGVRRACFVTTTGVFSKYNQFSSAYKENEAKIRCSGIEFTILRPSMIYGHPSDKNMSKLIKFLNKYPVFPIFSSGDSMMQPVFADDLADGIVSAIVNPVSINQEYNLAGPTGVAYRSLLNTILDTMNRKTTLINIPFGIASFIVKYGENLPFFPITHEQVLRLQEDKQFDISKSIIELGYNPRSFEAGISIEIAEMRNQKMI